MARQLFKHFPCRWQKVVVVDLLSLDEDDGSCPQARKQLFGVWSAECEKRVLDLQHARNLILHCVPACGAVIKRFHDSNEASKETSPCTKIHHATSAGLSAASLETHFSRE